jgi:hypothetical protein
MLKGMIRAAVIGIVKVAKAYDSAVSDRYLGNIESWLKLVGISV